MDAVKDIASLNADDQQMEQELPEKIGDKEEVTSSEDISLDVTNSVPDEVVCEKDEFIEDLGAEGKEKDKEYL